MITYVYFPPLRFDQVVTQVKSDEYIAKRVNVLLNRQYPFWFLNLLRALLFVGFVTSIYLIFLFIKAVANCLSCVS